MTAKITLIKGPVGAGKTTSLRTQEYIIATPYKSIAVDKNLVTVDSLFYRSLRQGYPDVVVIDEPHLLAKHQFFYVNQFIENCKEVIFLDATPPRWLLKIADEIREVPASPWTPVVSKGFIVRARRVKPRLDVPSLVTSGKNALTTLSVRTNDRTVFVVNEHFTRAYTAGIDLKYQNSDKVTVFMEINEKITVFEALQFLGRFRGKIVDFYAVFGNEKQELAFIDKLECSDVIKFEGSIEQISLDQLKNSEHWNDDFEPTNELCYVTHSTSEYIKFFVAKYWFDAYQRFLELYDEKIGFESNEYRKHRIKHKTGRIFGDTRYCHWMPSHALDPVWHGVDVSWAKLKGVWGLGFGIALEAYYTGRVKPHTREARELLKKCFALIHRIRDINRKVGTILEQVILEFCEKLREFHKRYLANEFLLISRAVLDDPDEVPIVKRTKHHEFGPRMTCHIDEKYLDKVAENFST